jgi:multimeric flavodoxin WrbA
MSSSSKILVILGSARKNSNTLKAIKRFMPLISAERHDFIDLIDKKIEPYQYEPTQPDGDDFHSIARSLLQYEVLVFATPVYWYSMSGQMKIFFDRLTELLYEYKSIGKALKGKKVYLIASGGNTELPEGFEIPFRHTAKYFDMEFVQSFYEQSE